VSFVPTATGSVTIAGGTDIFAIPFVVVLESGAPAMARPSAYDLFITESFVAGTGTCQSPVITSLFSLIANLLKCPGRSDEIITVAPALCPTPVVWLSPVVLMRLESPGIPRLTPVNVYSPSTVISPASVTLQYSRFSVPGSIVIYKSPALSTIEVPEYALVAGFIFFIFIVVAVEDILEASCASSTA
jgi:hypothetical protein